MLLQHCTVLAGSSLNKYDSDELPDTRLVDDIYDREELKKLARWIKRNFDSEETKRDYRVVLRMFAEHVTPGDGKPDAASVTCVIAVGSLGVVRVSIVSIVWIASGVFGPVGVWSVFAVANIVGCVFAFLWFRRGTWRGGDITSSSVGPSSTTEAEPEIDD